MTPADLASIFSLLKSAGPALLDAIEAVAAALREGRDPTPAMRHAEVQAAYELLGMPVERE